MRMVPRPIACWYLHMRAPPLLLRSGTSVLPACGAHAAERAAAERSRPTPPSVAIRLGLELGLGLGLRLGLG